MSDWITKDLKGFSGSVSKELHGGPANANATRRKARDHIKPCLVSLWYQRKHDMVPKACAGLHITLADTTFLQLIVTSVYVALNNPTTGDVEIEVRYRIWGDKGCGSGNDTSLEQPLGTIHVDFDTGLIHSEGQDAEFIEPHL